MGVNINVLLLDEAVESEYFFGLDAIRPDGQFVRR